jgi:hypothetical protein
MRSPAALVPVALAPLALLAPKPASPEPAEAGDSPFAAMLASVPGSRFEAGSDATLLYVDMALAWDEFGVTTDPDDRLEHLGQVGVDIGVPQLFGAFSADIEGAEAEVGFSVVNIEREIAVLLPPDSLIVDVTNVPPVDVVDALEANPTWSPELVQVDSQHGPYFSWGEGAELHPDRRSPLRPLGQAGELAVLGDEVATTVRTLDPAWIEDALGSYVGEVEPVSGGELLAPVVDGLAGAAVLQLTALATPPTLGLLPNLTPELLARLEAEALAPYVGISIAELSTDDGRVGEVLIVHADEATAAANAELVENALADGLDLLTNQPLAELLPDASVAVDGTVVRVTVPGDRSYRTLQRMLFARALFPAA